MILKANQYHGLSGDKVLTNKIRSINGVLRNTTVADIVVATYSNAFSLPESVQRYKGESKTHSSSNPVIKSYVRGQCSYFTISEEYTFEDPTIIKGFQMNTTVESTTLNSAHNYNAYAAGDSAGDIVLTAQFDPVGGVSGNELISTGLATPIATIGTETNTHKYTTTSASAIKEYLPLIGTLPDKYFALYYNNSAMPEDESTALKPYANPSDFKTISITQSDVYHAKLTATLPFFSAGAKKFHDSRKVYAYYLQYRQWLLQSIEINLIAQSTTIIEETFTTSDESPAFEITSNELLQTNIKVNGVAWKEWLNTIITRNKDGRMIVEFTIDSEKINIAQGDKIQLVDAMGNYLKNGAMFEVFYVYVSVSTRTETKKIKAVEVKNG